MIILVINKPGFFIHIPGLTPTRTPVELDVSKVSIDLVLTYLKSQGITEFQINSSDEITKVYRKYDWKNLTKKEQNIKETVVDINVNNILERFINSASQPKEVNINTADLEEKLLLFTKTLEKLISQVPSTIKVIGGVQQEIKDEVPDEEKFIPDIKNVEMSIRGSNISTTIEDTNQQEISNIVDILRENKGV